MKKLIYVFRGYLICYGIIGNIYKTKWRDTNPNKNLCRSIVLDEVSLY